MRRVTSYGGHLHRAIYQYEHIEGVGSALGLCARARCAAPCDATATLCGVYVCRTRGPSVLCAGDEADYIYEQAHRGSQ